MVILALDYGERRIGVAASDPLGIAAHGLENVENDGTPAVFDRIADLVRERSAERIIVGMPTQMDGQAGPAARRVQGFVKRLKAALPDVPVETVDERLTTAQAHRALSEQGARMKRRAEQVDRMAAQIILTRYLNQQSASRPGPEEETA